MIGSDQSRLREPAPQTPVETPLATSVGMDSPSPGRDETVAQAPGRWSLKELLLAIVGTALGVAASAGYLAAAEPVYVASARAFVAMTSEDLTATYLNGRFSSARKAVRFAGLDVTVHSSDGKRSPGHLSRQGPEVLRWCLYEAGKTHARGSAPGHQTRECVEIAEVLGEISARL